MNRRFLTSIVLFSLFSPVLRAETKEIELTVSAGAHDRTATPVCVLLELPANLLKVQVVALTSADGETIVGQLTLPGLLADETALAKGRAGTDLRELHFIVPSLKKGETQKLKAIVSTDEPKVSDAFAWHDTAGKYTELRFGSQPAVRYMYEQFDNSTLARRQQTTKPYHHVYDPAGERLVTGSTCLLHPHHRGLFFGFKKVTFGDGKKADTWGCMRDNFQRHQEFISSEAGPVLGRHCVLIHWHGQGKELFAKEKRELTVYRVPGGQLIDFAARVETALARVDYEFDPRNPKAATPKVRDPGRVKLDGDPHHAGFQIRAGNEVAIRTSDQTYFLRPDGKDKPGSARTWKAGEKSAANLPWDAMSFVLDDQRYTIAYLDQPANPKEARFGERDYGRFGSYFEYELSWNRPLKACYRVWVQKGEMTVADASALSNDFVEPVKVEVK